MSSIIKVDTIQDQDGNNIINESGNVITIGASGDTITVPAGATVSGFTSAGIDDNATSTAITISSGEDVTFTENILLSDNKKAKFGTGNDLEIYHSGTQSIISDVGSGNLNIEGDAKIVLRSSGGSENYAQFFKDGAVELYYDNSKKFETTSAGATVTGTATVDNTTGAELILFRNDTSIAIDDLIGGIQFKANDSSSSPDPQICGIKAISTGATNTNPKLSFFAGESNYNANTPDMTIDSSGTVAVTANLAVDTDTLFVDASENTVVVGGTDATSWNANADELVVAGASAGGMTFYNPTQSNIFFADGTSGSDVSRGRIQYVHSGDSLIFSTDATERARFSSNTFMVGKTSAGVGTNGVELKTNDESRFTQTARTVVAINRLSSDGNIVEFKKDNTTVGNLGSNSSKFYISSAGNAGLKFRNDLNAIMPCNSDGSNSDADQDLGEQGVRFRRLYLSEGIRLGGTGSANNLDDYEEGTWTPSIQASGTHYSSITHTVQNGRYTKVGRQVFAHFRVTISAVTIGSASGNINVEGLPFTCSSADSTNQAGTVSYVSDVNFNLSSFGTLNIGLNAYHSQNKGGIVRSRNSGTADGLHNSSIGQATDIVGTFIYFVD